MYSCLDFDPSEHLHVFGHTPNVFVKLHDEWQRLDDLEWENLSLLINQQWRQLEAMWEHCYVGEDDIPTLLLMIIQRKVLKLITNKCISFRHTTRNGKEYL
ncbi:hypothetical protein Pmani_021855 [Petrolisthes manimaculis]|uniref:Uncharacterized protein n=1 Tax=Petrolisthes manimaculis TaxID=1843537 RepID=A0AAE1U515_9EUCA|nr:hypothetical protein Pmani_021855 [Petrolisthes manimaculis]